MSCSTTSTPLPLFLDRTAGSRQSVVMSSMQKAGKILQGRLLTSYRLLHENRQKHRRQRCNHSFQRHRVPVTLRERDIGSLWKQHSILGRTSAFVRHSFFPVFALKIMC